MFTTYEKTTRVCWISMYIFPENSYNWNKRIYVLNKIANLFLLLWKICHSCGILTCSLYPHSQSDGYAGIPLSVCRSVRPSLSLVYVTRYMYQIWIKSNKRQMSFVGFYSYLVHVSWLANVWAWAYYTDFTDGWFLREL